MLATGPHEKYRTLALLGLCLMVSLSDLSDQLPAILMEVDCKHAVLAHSSGLLVSSRP